MNRRWKIERIDGAPRCVLQHWQVLEVSPTGPCHFPMPGPRFLAFAGCTDHYEIIKFSQEIVSFDPTRMVGACADGTVYGLGNFCGFTRGMTEKAKRSFWKSTLRPLDVSSEVLSIAGSRFQYAANAKTWDRFFETEHPVREDFER